MREPKQREPERTLPEPRTVDAHDEPARQTAGRRRAEVARQAPSALVLRRSPGVPPVERTPLWSRRRWQRSDRTPDGLCAVRRRNLRCGDEDAEGLGRDTRRPDDVGPEQRHIGLKDEDDEQARAGRRQRKPQHAPESGDPLTVSLVAGATTLARAPGRESKGHDRPGRDTGDDRPARARDRGRPARARTESRRRTHVSTRPRE